MAAVTVHLITEADAEGILRFELENRAFFAAALGDRSDDYFNLDRIREAIKEYLKEQEQREQFMYLVRDGAGEVVGRVNLFDVRYGDFERAEIGYRIGQRHNGKGYATQAVALVLKDAFEKYGLHGVDANVTPDNIGSQIVLIRNGFEFVGRAREHVRFNGVWHDFVHFAKTASR